MPALTNTGCECGTEQPSEHISPLSHCHPPRMETTAAPSQRDTAVGWPQTAEAEHVHSTRYTSASFCCASPHTRPTVCRVLKMERSMCPLHSVGRAALESNSTCPEVMKNERDTNSSSCRSYFLLLKVQVLSEKPCLAWSDCRLSVTKSGTSCTTQS